MWFPSKSDILHLISTRYDNTPGYMEEAFRALQRVPFVPCECPPAPASLVAASPAGRRGRGHRRRALDVHQRPVLEARPEHVTRRRDPVAAQSLPITLSRSIDPGPEIPIRSTVAQEPFVTTFRARRFLPLHADFHQGIEPSNKLPTKALSVSRRFPEAQLRCGNPEGNRTDAWGAADDAPLQRRTVAILQCALQPVTDAPRPLRVSG